MKPDTIEDVYSLSPMQSGMLFHTLYSPESGVYLDQVVCEIDGELERDVFELTWKSLIARHSVLRTTIHWQEVDEPLQLVHSDPTLTVQHLDWRSQCETEKQTCLDRLLEQDRALGICLSQLPLMRITLAHTGKRTWQMLWTFHHVLLDRWSVSLVLAEFKAVYRAHCTGRKIDLTAVQPYSEYIGWLQEQDKSTAEIYWRRTLQGIQAPTTLPIARPPGNMITRDLHLRQQLQLSLETTAALQALARRQRLTLNTLIQGAWAVLLNRYGGAEDVLFGTTVSGRPAALQGVEEMVGLFINSLPVRVSVDGSAPLLPWLMKLQDSLLELRDYEYSSLVEIQGWSEIPRGVPLFDSLVIVQNTPAEKTSEETGFDLKIVGGASSVDFPLMLTAVPGSHLSLFISYDANRFDTSHVLSLLGHISTILTSMAADPELRLSSLSMITDSERRLLVEKWNSTQADLPNVLVLHQRIEDSVERTPGAIALRFENESLTYSQLDRRANQVAHFLKHHGVGPDVLVGVCMERSVEMVVALLGILKAGGAYVPLDPSYPAERLVHMRSDAGMKVVLTLQALRAIMLPWDGVVVCLDTDWPSISQHCDQRPDCGVDPDNLAYVIYTSGSTGKPKGAMNSHRSICNRLLWMQNAYELSSSDRVLQKTPYSFDVSVWEFFWPLMTGACLVVAPPEVHRDPAALVELVQSFQITTLHFVPPMLQVFLEAERVAGCTSVRQVICSGEALPASLVNQFGSRLSARLHNLYGPTEAAVDVSYWECPTDGSVEMVPIGRPVWNTQLYILDRSMSPVPVGVPGELYLGGVQLARGYLNRPDMTADRFVPDPFSTNPGQRLYRTGDLVKFLPEGNVEYLGRLDHQVKIRGFRIELGEIENVLMQHPDVNEAVVLAREDTPGDRRLAAYLVCGQARELEIAVLRDYLNQRLPPYMVPSAFVFPGSLPLSANGKVDRRLLPAPDAVRPELECDYTPPQCLIEETLVRIWCDVLRLERIGIHDNFFELGGDSILSIQIIARANREGLRLTPRHVFQYQTIAGLAGVVDTVSVLPIERGVDSGPTPLTPIQHWFFERDLPDRHYFNQGRLLVFRQRVCSEDVERVCHLVVEHHDALRMRFERTESGWQQAHVSREENSFFTRVDLSGLAAADLGSAITDSCSQLQSSLDLTNGPLLRVAYFDLGPDQAARLFIVIHHLVVDGVSWGVLLSDLCLGLVQLERGEEPGLGSRTTSFQSWSKRLTEYAQSIALRNEQDYWLSETRRIVSCIPCVIIPTGLTLSRRRTCSTLLSMNRRRVLYYRKCLLYIIPRSTMCY